MATAGAIPERKSVLLTYPIKPNTRPSPRKRPPIPITSCKIDINPLSLGPDPPASVNHCTADAQAVATTSFLLTTSSSGRRIATTS